jgi:hypothetical protein
MKNKRIPVPALFAFITLILINCSKEKNQETVASKSVNLDSVSIEHSMKGWELYSWPNGSSWQYSILEGTNRIKKYEEVVGNDIIVSGNDSLKLLLDKFPPNEEIFWIGEEWLDRIWNGNNSNLSLPDQTVINEIKNYCIQKQLVLSITN